MIIDWNETLHNTAIKLTELLASHWEDQKLALDLEYQRLRTELEEKQICTEEQWNNIETILMKIKTEIEEESNRRRPKQRVIRQASKIRIIDPENPTSSMTSAQMDQPKDQRPPRKRDASSNSTRLKTSLEGYFKRKNDSS